MKFSVFSLFLYLASTCAIGETLRLSDPVATDAHTETFGEVLPASLPDVTLSDLAKSPDDFRNSMFQITTRIAKVCQKKGCFFIAQEDDTVMRVAFKDYGFFIPTDASGKTVTLAGELVQVERTKLQADHFNSDLAGNGAGLQAGKAYEIIASSVRIPK